MSSPDRPDDGEQPPTEQPSDPQPESVAAPSSSDANAFYGQPPTGLSGGTNFGLGISGGAVPGGTVSGETMSDAGSISGGGSMSDAGTIVVSDGAADEPILPATFDEAQLRDAVGAAPRRAKRRKAADDDLGARRRDAASDDDGDPSAKKLSRRTMAISALAIVAGLGISALVFLGRANSQRYLIACTTDHVSAERGRSFPPWGSQTMNGAEWKAIPLPANGECKARETEDLAELEHWYLDLLVERASTTLTASNLIDGIASPGTAVTATAKGMILQNPLDVVAEQLNQALLLSRAPERRDQRKEVERLLGDVQYWRASLRLRDASAALFDASRQFDAAAAQRPRHVTDAGAWGAFLRKLSDELRAGPGGVMAEPLAAQPSAPPAAPAGVALPVEPTDETSGSDTAPSSPDAGVPTGGVLL